MIISFINYKNIKEGKKAFVQIVGSGCNKNYAGYVPVPGF